MLPSPRIHRFLSCPAMLCLVLGALPAHGSGQAPVKAGKAAAQPDRPALRELPNGAPSSAQSAREALRLKLKAKIAGKQAGRTAGTPSARPQAAVLKPGEFTFTNASGRTCVLGPSANLVNADLRGGDFRGKDLRGADLRGALFNGATLTGTKFQGAKVMDANFGGATGADLAGARLHPFFESHGAEPVGTVKLIEVVQSDDAGSGYPRNLQVHPGGALLWLEGAAGNVRALQPTGTNHRIQGGVKQADSRLHAMVVDSRDRLWTFGDRTVRVHDYSSGGAGLLFGGAKVHGFPTMFSERPLDVSAGQEGMVWVNLASGLLCFIYDEEGFEYSHLTIPPALAGSTGLRMSAGRGGKGLVYLGPGQDELFADGKEEGLNRCFKKPACGAIHGLAHGADGRLFHTQSDPAGIAWVQLPSNKSGFIRPLGEGDPRGIVLGPDGRIWWTEPGANRIGRLGPDDVPEYFDLPEGTHPQELVAGPGGRLFFTLRESFRLGSIRAVAVAKDGEAADAKESKAHEGRNPGPAVWTAPDFKPRPGRVSKYAKGKQRTAFLEGIAQEAEVRFQARLAAEPEAPAPPPEWYSKEKDGEAVEDEKAATAPGTPEAALKDLDPRETLAALNVNLAPGAVRHILAQHAHKAKRHKSQFSAALSGEKEIEALIAQGLVAAGDAMASIKSPPRYRFDRRGRFLTLCRREHVGRHNSYGTFRRTSKFIVVTESFDGEDGPSHDVVTAYPVSDRW